MAHYGDAQFAAGQAQYGQQQVAYGQQQQQMNGQYQQAGQQQQQINGQYQQAGQQQMNGMQQQQQQQQYGQQQQQYGQQQAYGDQGQEQQMAEQYQEFIERSEETDGVRFSWNNFPANRIEGTRNVVPLSMLYTPLNRRSNITFPYGPLLCQVGSCKTILNPYCRVDFQNRVWTCVFCGQRNAFPQSYASMTPENKPGELHQAYG